MNKLSLESYDSILKSSLLVNFLWSYISAEWQEKFELESTFYEITEKSKNLE